MAIEDVVNSGGPLVGVALLLTLSDKVTFQVVHHITLTALQQHFLYSSHGVGELQDGRDRDISYLYREP